MSCINLCCLQSLGKIELMQASMPSWAQKLEINCSTRHYNITLSPPCVFISLFTHSQTCTHTEKQGCLDLSGAKVIHLSGLLFKSQKCSQISFSGNSQELLHSSCGWIVFVSHSFFCFSFLLLFLPISLSYPTPLF